jgi:O-glycosyl hydrolase
MNRGERFVLCLFLHLSTVIHADGYGKYNQLANIDFENGTPVDALNNLTASLMNGAAIVADGERGGKVLQFSAETKGCLKLNTNPLSDTISVTFRAKREDANPSALWRMFFAWYADDGSNIYLTPLTSWGNSSFLIMDNKPYASYKSLAGTPVQNNRWYHIAVVFANNHVKYYLDGVLQVEATTLFRLSDFRFTKFFFGCNPELNYPMSGRIDDVMIFHYALYENQVKALYEGRTLPEPETAGTATAPPIELDINPAIQYQTIRNFGASDGWNAQTVGMYFPENKKETIAKLLFSCDTLPNGTPEGIGLSCWRFNIGAGTAEQGDASRIAHYSRRTECFLNPDKTTYDWTKQAGQRWFLEKAAKEYGVADIIGWQNAPPVYYTIRGLGFREYGDAKNSILKKEHYADFGNFLANVINHFKEEGIDFKYISPLNEPQWDWNALSAGAQVQQEGTPWVNREISDVVKAINTAFKQHGVMAKQFITEAGSIDYLLNEETGDYAGQLGAFWNKTAPMSVASLSSFSNTVSSHSYWTDASANDIVGKRNRLRDQIKNLNPELEYWQTEYCLMGSGYKQWHANSSARNLTPMECAVSMARIIHNDLAEGDAAAWQWWTTFEFDSMAGTEDRYALIRFELNTDMNDGVFLDTKLLYALGNYSRFIRPGMKRIYMERSDKTDAVNAVSNQMFSVYRDSEQLVIVAVNTSSRAVAIRINIPEFQNGWHVKTVMPYVTSADPLDNLKRYPDVTTGSDYTLPATSVVTFVGKIEKNETAISHVSLEQCVVYPNPASGYVTVFLPKTMQQIIVRDISGKVLKRIPTRDRICTFPVNSLTKGTYLVSVESDNYIYTKKLLVK